jgi:signal transduction histidine kinase
VSVTPLLDGEGRVYQVVELTQDVTNQKLFEAEMMHASKMASLGVMAAGVAHEVGNPLASISARLRLLREPHDEGFLSESLEILDNEISRIGRILQGVSLLARPDQVAWKRCQINAIVAETLTVLGLNPKARICKIESHLEEPMPHTTGSRDGLFQVFLNLGLNALEEMPQGGTLTVRTYAAKGEICVTFSDTGQGMSKDVLSRMFTPFFTTKRKGLGLGLYMVQNIIGAHDGRIDVQSDLGTGTVVTVVLPVRVAKRPKRENKPQP